VVQPRGTPAISGVVTDLDTGAPVAAAEITLFPTLRRKQGDSLGRFALDSVAPGRYLLRTLRIGYEPRRDSITVSSGSGLTVRLPLVPRYLDRCSTVERVPAS
jgi:hypothetical protein